MISDETPIQDQNQPLTETSLPSTGESAGNQSPVQGSVPIADPWGTEESAPSEFVSASGSSPSLPERFVSEPMEDVTTQLTQRVADLQRQEQELKQSIAQLQATNSRIQAEQRTFTQSMGSLISEALGQLEQRKQALQVEVEKLERRRDRIQKEMRTTFAGTSQELAIRVQGFKDYLVGSLQDLVTTAEQLDLVPPEAEPDPRPRDVQIPVVPASEAPQTSPTPQFAEQGFQEQTKRVRQLLDQYRNTPDYYGPPWQLRRTFEPIHAKRVSNWFFTQGGRGALRTMGSRLQNILIASSVISILRSIYGTRLRTLVLANSPERLGEWRRGLQDCLGIDRRDFGPEQGVVLFEEAEVLSQKAERIVKEGRLPLIIIDDMEDKISLSLLQFPLWLAFAPDPQTQQQQPIERY